MEVQTGQGERLLRIREVMSRTGIGKTYVYDLMRAGAFPRAVVLSRRTVVWPASAIDAWIAERLSNATHARR